MQNISYGFPPATPFIILQGYRRRTSFRACRKTPWHFLTPLSQQIKILETHLGVQLFDRSRSGVRLTAVGHQILPAVDRLLLEGENLESSVMEARLGLTARISIAAIAFTMSDILPQILKIARKQIKNLSVNIREFDSNEALISLENEYVDIAFLRAEESSGHLNIVPLVRENLVLATQKKSHAGSSG